jgi:membrane protein
VSGLRRLLARLKASRPYRTWERYGAARGDVLAGGVTYLGFFSIIPALLLGFTVFGFVLRGQPALFDQVVGYVSQTLPGIVRDAAHPNGLIDASNPPTPNALTITGLVSLGTLLLSGTGWVDALRESVRAVFGRPRLDSNPVKTKLLDVVLLATLGLAFLLSGVLSLGVSSAGSWLLDQVGVGGGSLAGQLVLRGGSVLAVLVADTLLVVVVLRLMSGLQLPRSDLVQGSLLGAVGLGILKQVSGLLLASAAHKPVIGSFAVIVGLLVLLNLISRVLLLSAAWAATRAEEGGRLTAGAPAQQQAAVQHPAPQHPARRHPAPQHAAALQPREAVLPSFGQRSADRTAVAAGAVLGVIAAVGVRAARSALRSAVDGVRGR